MAFFAINRVGFLLPLVTTVTTIVLAATNVVLVVTVPVTLQIAFSTLAIALDFFLWINARTVFAVSRHDFCFAAITTIILASTVVVFVITVAIAHVVLSAAFTLAVG